MANILTHVSRARKTNSARGAGERPLGSAGAVRPPSRGPEGGAVGPRGQEGGARPRRGATALALATLKLPAALDTEQRGSARSRSPAPAAQPRSR